MKKSKNTPVGYELRSQFSVQFPALLGLDPNYIKLEIKPYLQPFEVILAERELKSLLSPGDVVSKRFGYYVVNTNIKEELLRDRLTYWQRVGKNILEPTLQKLLEFTQNGISHDGSTDLHNNRRLRYGPHDLHEYRGKFFPQLVKSLINISGLPDNSIILDPMCGSGTTLCEAIAANNRAIGADLNPLSVLISKVKAATIGKDANKFKKSVLKNLECLRFNKSMPLSRLWGQADLEYLKRWFDPKALQEIESILIAIYSLKNKFYQDFFRICLSNIVRSISWQKDVDLRVRKEVSDYISGSAQQALEKEVLKQMNKIFLYLEVLDRRRKKPEANIRLGDAVDIAKIFPKKLGEVDLLITSPPYATALPYLDTDRLSLIILGLLPRKKHKEIELKMVGTREISEKKREQTWVYFLKRSDELPTSVVKVIKKIASHNHKSGVGFRRRNLPALLGLYFLNMLDSMRSARMLMAPKGHGFYIVGNNSTFLDEKKLEIPTDKLLYEIGKYAGWKPKETLSMELLSSRDIFKGNKGSAETILFFGV